MNPPRIHDLNELRKLCAPFDRRFEDIANQCSDLTVYGVQPRYPMEYRLEETDMIQALNAAKEVRGFVITLGMYSSM